MDGRATASPHPTDTSDVAMQPQQEPDKISAYYSLVFPNFTYYLQTLSVTIGRRCIPIATGSSNDVGQVDVDLGPLKSVSRLHAKIEYEEDEERFVLVVIGRNGAWVDGIWSPSGTKVPLSERSHIQIASRTFDFVLPPPPAPEDSPSPSSHSSVNRPRSPSVDITSISPPSSMPSRSPPPAALPRSVPDIPPLTTPHIPTDTIKPRANHKKRKKPNSETPSHPKPQDIPPRPPFTYAQLCYRAIKAIGGKATLQEICRWITEAFDWYKYNDAGWQSSVRHNLSSNRAFKKLERCGDGRGKGFFWSVDEKFEHMFEEHDGKHQAGKLQDGTTVKDGKPSRKKDKGGASLLDPPLKRSVKGGPTGALLPPPLTSTPLKYPTSTVTPANPQKSSLPGPTPSAPVNSDAPTILLEHAFDTRAPGSVSNAPVTPAARSSESNGLPQTASSIPAIPPSLFIPIVVGPIPESHPSSSLPTGPLTSTPIVLHDGKLILNPDVFSHLTPEQVKELEALGAQKALPILQSYIARFLKEQRLKKRDSARGRGRGRGQAIRSRGSGGRKGEGASAPGTEHQDNTTAESKNAHPTTSPFTMTPLPPRPLQPQPVQDSGNRPEADVQTPLAVPALVVATPALPIPLPRSNGIKEDEEDAEAIIVVDDSDTFQPPAAKKRRLEVVAVGSGTA